MKLSTRLQVLAASGKAVDSARVKEIQAYLKSTAPECKNLNVLLTAAWERFAEGPLLEEGTLVFEVPASKLLAQKSPLKEEKVLGVLTLLAVQPTLLQTVFELAREAYARQDAIHEGPEPLFNLKTAVAASASTDRFSARDMWGPMELLRTMWGYYAGRKRFPLDDGAITAVTAATLWDKLENVIIATEEVAAELRQRDQDWARDWADLLQEGFSISGAGFKNPYAPIVDIQKMGVPVSLQRRNMPQGRPGNLFLLTFMFKTHPFKIPPLGRKAKR